VNGIDVVDKSGLAGELLLANIALKISLLLSLLLANAVYDTFIMLIYY
jgi:hypothetical protein